MNTALYIIFALILIFSAWSGYKRGLVLSTAHLAAIAVSLYLACLLSSAFSGEVLSEFIPMYEVAAVSGGKWKFAKAASVKWAKPKKGAALPAIYDEASGKGLVVDTSKGTNFSGLKLASTPKKGTFKGSFNVYALVGTGSATKLKKYKLNVNGVVVDGTGHGSAICKSPALIWPVKVE